MHETASSGTLAGPSAVSTEEVGHRARDRYQRCLREGVPFWVLALDVFGLERITQEHSGSRHDTLQAILSMVHASG